MIQVLQRDFRGPVIQYAVDLPYSVAVCTSATLRVGDAEWNARLDWKEGFV